MTEMLEMLDVGYTLIWRANRLERALEGLPDDFEWVVPEHPEGAVQCGGNRGLALIQMSGSGRESGVPVEVRMVFYNDLGEARRGAGPA